MADTTQIVIEGFPRSGNTFAQVAFESAQRKPVSVAHHTHAAGQVLVAARRGVPTILTLRRPIDAVISHSQYYAGVSMATALISYVIYYTRCLAVRDKVVVATFDQITSDFGAVIDKVNAKFHTDFERFEHTEENVARCFEVIDSQVSEQKFGSARERVLPRPTQSRERDRPELRDRYARLPGALRRRADRLYASLAG